jgi:hypothetical protein
MLHSHHCESLNSTKSKLSERKQSLGSYMSKEHYLWSNYIQLELTASVV